MSKRIVLSDREVSHIVAGLKKLQKECNLDYAVVGAGRVVYQDIINRLTGVTTATSPDSNQTESGKNANGEGEN